MHKKHYDYRGNEIKDGMTVCVIVTRALYEITSFGFMMPNETIYVEKDIKIENVSDDKYPRIIEEYDIVSIDDRLFYKKQYNGKMFNVDLSCLFGINNNCIVAIKGLSDDIV